ncbi:ATP-binding protein [Nocardia salmonicida]|uniref:ATP-binding protein n=1 Tax=Nocardia salmonicida TaxID=53431 RepID=UPI00364DF644
MAWVVVAAVREALTNVERHADANHVSILLREQRVTVADNGIGISSDFDRAENRHGIRRSIVERMSSIGGSAEITGTTGTGTEVELSWPADGPVRAPMEPEHDSAAARRLETGLSVGIAGVSVADTTLQLTRLIDYMDPIPPAWVHLMLATVNIACAVFAVSVVRRRVVTTVALMTTVIAISALLCIWIPAGQQGLNWTVGAVGWTVVALGLRGSRRVTTAALSVWWAVVVGVVIIGSPDRDAVAYTVYLTAGVLYLQIAIVTFAASMHRVVRVVAEREQLRREVDAAAAVDAALNQECERRYRRQLTSVLPMLRGIADGALSPESPDVQLGAQTEYSRLRRLFARVDSMDHQLFADIRDAVDDAEARGVKVVIDASPDLPELPGEGRAIVSGAIRIMLAGSRSRARLTVVAEDGDITVSLVCDAEATAGDHHADQPGGAEGVTTQLVVDEASGMTWLRLRCHQRVRELVPS